MTLTLSQINIYPVKSLGGSSPEHARVEARGLQHDRRWMVVNLDGKFLTQRELPRMACIAANVLGNHLRLEAPGVPALSLPLESSTETKTLSVRVWRSVCEAQAVIAEADAWLSDFLGVPCRLVYMPDTTRRSVNPDFTAGEGIVSFADGYPLMLLGEASLHDLNARLNVPVPMSRFRPSLVVSGTNAYAEDDWRSVRIGDVLFHAVKPCARCMMPTIDQETGQPMGEEPLRTLASYRLRDRNVLFGVYLIPASEGWVKVGDVLEASERSVGEELHS